MKVKKQCIVEILLEKPDKYPCIQGRLLWINKDNHVNLQMIFSVVSFVILGYVAFVIGGIDRLDLLNYINQNSCMLCIREGGHFIPNETLLGNITIPSLT